MPLEYWPAGHTLDSFEAPHYERVLLDELRKMKSV
jgi:hypothetical protein